MVTVGRRERNKARKIERILAAARARFAKRSFQSATMRAIAEDADVAVGTLYTYFRDKVALAEAISAQDLERVTREVMDSLPQTSVRQQLQHVFGAFYDHHRQDISLARVVVKELSLAEDSGSTLREERFMALFVRLAELVTAGQQRGELVADVSPFDVAVNAFGLHYFYLVGWLSGQPGFDPPESHLERALALLFRGLEP